MKRTETIVIGAGQAGLAVSRALFDRDHDHVVLERGRVAQRWTERWDSLQLLTPNWMSRLPGWGYSGSDPNGFMTRDDVIAYLSAFSRSFQAPVQDQTTVLGVEQQEDGWKVATDQGDWRAKKVVIATGHSDQPNIPATAVDAPSDLYQVASSEYKNPQQMPAGGVLVVGASASGVQLADEMRRSGREVVIAVGSHTRLPRQYRGHDIMYWLDRLGSLDRPASDIPDPKDRHEPSLQLVGRDTHESLDLAVLRSRGVQLAGHLTGFDGDRAKFAKDLHLTTTKADLQLRQILERIEMHIAAHDLDRVLPAAEPMAPVPLDHAVSDLNLRAAGIRSVLWATGYRRTYPWLQADVLDERGELRQVRGRTPAAGLYVLGLQFMIRRRSSLIDGVGRDAIEIAQHITAEENQKERAAA